MKKILYIIILFSFSLLTTEAQEIDVKKIFSKSFEVVNEKNKKGSFKGQILKGKQNGMGLLLQKDGSLYVGDFYRDEISGYGMLIAKSGNYVDNCDSCTIYIGNWQNGLKSGFGTCYTCNGDIIYQGLFKENKPTSQYPSTDIDQLKYFSCLVLNNGVYFLGEIKQCLANGYGIMVFNNGDLWFGNFKDGNRNGVGLYLQYDGEWEALNFEGDGYNVISSSINYKNIDTERKANIKSSLSEAFGYFAEASSKAIQVSKGIQTFKNGDSSLPTSDINQMSYDANVSTESKNDSQENESLNTPYSLTANQNKNTDSKTYANYDGMLSKMRYGNMEYNDSKRREYQSKMKSLRLKWEKRGEKFQHSENEVWLGK